MLENVFKKKYAECLIARIAGEDGKLGEAVGLALVSTQTFQATGLAVAAKQLPRQPPLTDLVLLHLLHLARSSRSLRE